MTRSLVFLCPVLGLMLACAPSPQGPSAAAMIAAADALDQAFLAAFNRGDAEAMASLYWNSPDVVSFLPDDLQVKGFDAVKRSLAQMLASMPGAKLEISESHQMPAGDVVIGWGLWRMTMAGSDGAPMEMVGRYTDVKAERDGKWVYLMDHASVPLPPPPPPAGSAASRP